MPSQRSSPRCNHPCTLILVVAVVLVGLMVAAWALRQRAKISSSYERYADASTTAPDRPRLVSSGGAQVTTPPAQFTAELKRQLQALPFAPKPPPTPDPPDTVTLLWSGGVASTFELCDQLLRRKKTVRPVHLTGTSLDTRQSTQQERTTVEAMDVYLRKHFPNATKSRLLPTIKYLYIDHDGEGTDASAKTKLPPTTREAVAQALGVAHTPHAVSTFYVFVAALARSMSLRPPLNGQGRLVVVLPKDGPHALIRFAVEAWGAPVDPRDPSRVVVSAHTDRRRHLRRSRHRTSSPLERVYGVRAETADRQVFVSLYNRVEWILPDRAPEGRDLGLRARAHQPPFVHVLRRAWSCRQPHLTQEQAKRRETNRVATLTMVPVGECKRCASCEQRKQDGLVRVR